jgi:hypothetical protein
MLCRVQPSLRLFWRRIPCLSGRIYASSTAPRSDDDWERDKSGKSPTDNESTGEEASIAAMIGPYVSSKQIAFHTGQFDSEHIKKKNKQAFLVGRPFFVSSCHK